jgi:hypothetical protein
MGVFPMLDLIVGLSFVYLLLALVCTTVMEWIAQWRNMRGTFLVEGTSRLFGEADAKDQPFTQTYLRHPLIRTLRDRERTPSYVPSRIFAMALRDTLKHAPKVAGVAASRPAELEATLAALKDDSDTATATADEWPSEDALALWYDQAMERVSGTYKRKTRTIVFWLAAAITLAFNANTITLSSNLWKNPTLRAYLVERAKVRLDQGAPLETVEYTNPTSPNPSPPRDSTKSPDRLLAEEQSMLGELFSWSTAGPEIGRMRERFGSTSGLALWLLLSLIGWTITALAVSLGAPFWFDTLNRFMQLRSSGAPPPPIAQTRDPAKT